MGLIKELLSIPAPRHEIRHFKLDEKTERIDFTVEDWPRLIFAKESTHPESGTLTLKFELENEPLPNTRPALYAIANHDVIMPLNYTRLRTVHMTNGRFWHIYVADQD